MERQPPRRRSAKWVRRATRSPRPAGPRPWAPARQA